MIVLLRLDLEGALGYELEDALWEFLVKEGYAGKVDSGELTIDDLADKVEDIFEAASSPLDRRRQRRQRPRVIDVELRPSARKEALSDLFARAAEEERPVETFRSEVLHEGLVSLDEVKAWIERQAKADGAPTLWLKAVLPPQTELRQLPGRRLVPEPPIVIDEQYPGSLAPQKQYLSYSLPDEDRVGRIAITAGGVLERLQQVAEYLADRYGWGEAQATIFVLTGVSPTIRPLTATTRLRSLSAASRILLTIDPTVSPRGVSEAYRRIRQQVLGKRHRDLSEKHVQLALFAAERPASEPLKERMTAWNMRYPEWQYDRVTSFGRDCAQARRRLLNPDYRLPKEAL